MHEPENERAAEMAATEESGGSGRAKMIGRRRLFQAGGLAVAGAALAPAVSAAQAIRESDGAGSGSLLGPKRTIASAMIFGSCPCVHEIQVGFRDAARLVGWNYKPVLSEEQNESAGTLTKVYENALTFKPDVLAGGMWFAPALGYMKKAQAKKIYVLAVNTADTTQTIPLNIPFIGPDYEAGGARLGQLCCAELVKKGVKKGTIITGVATPGSLPLEKRLQGIQEGVKAYNKANGTNFKDERFNDLAGSVLTKSIAQYKTKVTQVGSDLVGFASTGGQTGSAIYNLAKQSNWKPGQYTMVSLDTDFTTNQAIREGWFQGSIDQEFYLQGFVTGMTAWMALNRFADPPLIYDTGSSAIVTKANVALFDKRNNYVDKTLSKALGEKI